jgi:hypothetical protein
MMQRKSPVFLFSGIPGVCYLIGLGLAIFFSFPLSLRGQAKWIYTIYHHNLPTTRLTFTFGDTLAISETEFFALLVTAQNLNFSNLLFHVENKYRTLIGTGTFLPLQIEKEIDQKNIGERTVIRYDQTAHVAVKDTSFSWQIPAACHNYFSLLLFLRNQPLVSGDCYPLNLDVEFLIWQVTARVTGLEVIECQKQPQSAIRVDLSYQPITGQQSRPWKTDLLTNRIAQKGGGMTVWFAADLERKILRVNYDEDTLMLLTKTE